MKRNNSRMTRSVAPTRRSQNIKRGAGLLLVAVALAYWGFDTEVSKTVPESQAQAKASTERRPLLELIEEEQKLKQKSNPEAPKKPVATHTKPGVKFVADQAPPRSQLVQHPEMGEVIELTYADGSKLYKPNDPVYDWTTGETKDQELTNQ